MTLKPPTDIEARMERLRYDGFRAFLLGRAPTERLADTFARQVVACGEQGKYGYKGGESAKVIAGDLYYWVC